MSRGMEKFGVNLRSGLISLNEFWGQLLAWGFIGSFRVWGLIRSFRVSKLKVRPHYVLRSGVISLNPNFGVNWSIWGFLGNKQTDGQTDRQTDKQTDRSSFYIYRY